jgi:adenine-specific DNA methylase
MHRLIEVDFPIRELNELVPKEKGITTPPIYQMHKWWAHRAGCIFRTLILAAFLPEDAKLFDALGGEFYKKHTLNKVILDPFMGAGTTLVEGLRLGCKVIGLDIHPVAWFIVKNALEPIDVKALDSAFKSIEGSVAPKIRSYYHTRCLRGHQAEVKYIFWVNKVPCQRGGEMVRLFPNYILAREVRRNNQEMDAVFCPECYAVWWASAGATEVTCPKCSTTFNPKQGVTDRGCFRCEHGTDSVLDVVRKWGHPPEAEMFAIEYYCPQCKGRDYKSVDEEDIRLFEKAKSDWDAVKDQVMGKLVPDQEIPEKDRADIRPINYNYRYFHQMFNERQLLCLSLLLGEILKVQQPRIQEALLLAYSDSLRAVNMFATYHAGHAQMRDLFAHHAYIPPAQVAETNVWGTGMGFLSCYANFKEGVEYRLRPWSANIGGKPPRKLIGDGVEGRLASSYSDLVENNCNTLLRCGTAEDLSFLPSQSVDAVITDPPYCDNVMYGELADFFYVWQRLGLKDSYPWYRPSYTPKKSEGELVVITGGSQEEQQRQRMEFWLGLIRCYRECRRVLKDDGFMVFTFHHSQPWAWAGLLWSILESGFVVDAIYPVTSEQETTIHRGGAGYDIPCVCRKRKGESRGEATLGRIKGEVYKEVAELFRSYRAEGKGLSDEDVFVILMGKCLQVFSRYYPKVYGDDGQPVRGEDGIRKALEDMADMVDTVINEEDLREIPAGVDETTRDYCLHVAGRRGLTKDDIDKRFKVGGENFLRSLERQELIKRDGKKVAVVPPAQRKEYLEEHTSYTVIDQLHRLYNDLKTKGSVALSGITNPDAVSKVARLLFLKTGDSNYKTLHDYIQAVGGRR